MSTYPYNKQTLMQKEQVILVDQEDNEVGTAEKMSSHQEGMLHRAFSIFIVNNKNEILLQKRAKGKYHCAGLWTNTCCSHPRPGESLLEAAHRRLQEEMGFDCPLEDAFTFMYRVEFENGLIEHELDHVLIGTHDGPVDPDPQEVSEYRWMPIEELKQELSSNEQQFTPWLNLCWDQALSHLLTLETEHVHPMNL